ncbi:MAG: hypothetical protein KDC91_07770 [Flavobacteriaceae bacterium]|nr:hypothetical protein [Flavobacteriaceae bacterium]
MQKLFSLIILSTLFQGCNDGEIINTSFDFDNATVQFCSGSDSFLFYKINDAKTEAISLLIQGDSDLFITSDTTSIALNTTNFVNYRIFNSEVTSNYFCTEVPPITPQVISEYIGNSGNVTLITIATYDDDDGVPLSKEFNGDTDMDGIPDYFDFDDDGDNVPTRLELDTENADGDNDPLTNPKDTDDDGIADYLDPDDDNDGVLTIDEDANMNLNPTDDIADSTIGPNFLNENVHEKFSITEYRKHTFDFTTDAILKINNLILVNENEQRIYETLNFGTIEGILSGELSTTPDF